MQAVWSLSQRKECTVTSSFFWISTPYIRVSSENITSVSASSSDPEFHYRNITSPATKERKTSNKWKLHKKWLTRQRRSKTKKKMMTKSFKSVHLPNKSALDKNGGFYPSLLMVSLVNVKGAKKQWKLQLLKSVSFLTSSKNLIKSSPTLSTDV